MTVLPRTWNMSIHGVSGTSVPLAVIVRTAFDSLVDTGLISQSEDMVGGRHVVELFNSDGDVLAPSAFS